MFVVNAKKVLSSSQHLIKCAKVISMRNNALASSSIWSNRKCSTLTETKSTIDFEDEIPGLFNAYLTVRKELLREEPLNLDKEAFGQFIDYNFYASYQALMLKPFLFLYRNVSPEWFKRIPTADEKYTVAIILEMFGLISGVADDILDNTKKRFMLPCWYTFNDKDEIWHHYLPAHFTSIMIYLGNNTEKYPYYRNLSALYYKDSVKFLFSEVMNSPMLYHHRNMESMEFNCHQMHLIVERVVEVIIKTILYLIGYEDIPYEKELDQILKNVGYYGKSVNDYLDYFGDPDICAKKMNADIDNGILTWPVAHAWKIGSEEQKKLILENFGRPSQENFDAICRVINELNLREKFLTFEKEILSEIENDVKNIPDKCIQSLTLNMVYVFKHNFRKIGFVGDLR